MRLRTIARGAGWGAALIGLSVAGGAAAITLRHALMTPRPLTSGLPGEWRVDRDHGGAVYYPVAGPEDAQPLVLLHDFYPGASNYEFRAIYARLAQTYRVYAPDWLGFGMSERPDLQPAGEFYAAMLNGFLRDVAGRPAIVVARGRAANIAVRSAADAPALFERLVLVAPDLDSGDRLDPTAAQVIVRMFQRFGLGLTPYAALSSRPMLRLAQGLRSAVGPSQVDDETLDHLYDSAHQYGGQYGALALLTGDLDLPLQHVFPALEPPTLLVTGESDRMLTPARLERLVALNPHADLEIVPGSGATVYQDQPKLFVFTLHRWLARSIARQAPHILAQAPSMLGERIAAPGSAAVASASRAYASAATMPAAAPRPAPQAATPESSGAPVKIVPVLDPQRPPADFLD
jgi:pimeloyl-ACP methyl ester carboxylesterase